MSAKSVTKTRVDVRGDVTTTRKSFAAPDLVSKPAPSPPPPKKKQAPAPAQLIVEDDTGVPSWAVNQQKLLLRKENARSSIRDVDVKELQGSVLSEGARDGSEVQRERVQMHGNVKAALAMWGRTADDDAKLLAERRAEEQRKAAEAERLRKIAEEERKLREVKDAVSKFASLTLKEMPEIEPESDVELVAYLERKIVLIEREIKLAEEELDELEAN